MASQDLSTYVSPSEDEWLEALRLGEISYVQYLCLAEIARQGVDSSSLYLLDEIPNLAYFLETSGTGDTPLEQDQQRVVTSERDENEAERRLKGSFDYRYLQRFEDEDKSWYRSTSRVEFSEDIEAVWRINRESSGRERIVYRSAKYAGDNGLVRSVIVGNFTTRFGLGTLFGYRGKLMSCSGQIDGESLAYPDYGGYNGLHLVGRAGAAEVQMLGSVVRDEDHRMFSWGAIVKDRSGSFRPGFIAGINQLTARQSRERLTIPMFAGHAEYRYGSGSTTAEIARQTGLGESALAAVLEGRHRLETAEIRYAGWFYGNDFRDLTSGSKAGSLYQSCCLEDVDFELSSKRTGQEGALLKTTIDLSRGLKGANSLLVARRKGGNSSSQFSSALITNVGKRSSLQLDFLWRQWCKTNTASVDREDRRRWRLEGRFNSGDFYIRSYIGYNTESERRGYLSLFATMRVNFKAHGLLELWSNLHRLTTEGVEYWYFFVRGEQTLGDNLKAGVKLAHTYRNDPGNRGETTFSLGVTADL